MFCGAFFNHIQYLSIDPTLTKSILDSMIADGYRARNEIRLFEKYLNFEGRGIPRQIFQTIYPYVSFDAEGRGFFEFSNRMLRKFRCISKLEDSISEIEPELLQNNHGITDPEALDTDRLVLRCLADWIIERGLREFTLDNLIGSTTELIDLAPLTTTKSVRANAQLLISSLIRNEFVEFITDSDLDRTVLQGSNLKGSKNGSPSLRFSKRRLIELGRELQNDDLQEQSIVDDRYRLLELIAEGGIGSAYRAKDLLTHQFVVVKTWNTSDLEMGSIVMQREYETLCQLPSSYFPKPLQFINQPTCVAIVMEEIIGKTLEDIVASIDSLDSVEVAYIACQISNILQELHQFDFVWGDVKPTNVMITDLGTFQGIDFGLLLTADSGSSQIAFGTPIYTAPEVRHGGSPDKYSDIYSLGVLLFKIITGEFPSVVAQKTSNPFADVIDKTTDEILAQLMKSNVTTKLAEVVGACLAPKPEGRPHSVELIYDSLNDTQAFKEMRPFWIEAKNEFDRNKQIDESETLIVSQFSKQNPSRSSNPALQTQTSELHSNKNPTVFMVRSSRTTFNDKIEYGSEGTEFDRVSQPIETFDLKNTEFLVEGPGGQQIFQPKTTQVTIGRSSVNTIQLEDYTISRFHFNLELVDGAWTVSPGNSSNGILLDGQYVTAEQKMKSNNLLEFGKSSLILRRRNH